MGNVKKMLVVGAVLSGAFVLSACNLYKTPQAPTGGDQTQQTIDTESTTGESVAITYSDNGFSPSSIKVKVGENVEFKNTSSESVQVNSAVHPTHQLYPELNVGTIASGGSKSVTLTTTGTKKYHNHLSPGQTGEIVVE